MKDNGEKEEEEEDKEKPEHFYCMTYLVVTIGTDIVCQLFVKDIPTGQSVGTFLKNNEKKIKLLERKYVFNEYQLQLLKSSPPDVNKFDISLLYILICNLSNMTPPSGGWNQAKPLASDFSPAALLMKLKTARNDIIAHSPNGKMTKSSFEKHWSATSDILIDLAGAISQDEKRAVKKKVDEMRKKPIGHEVCKQNTLVMWTLQDHLGVMSSKLDELSTKMATQETRTGSIDTTVHALQDQMETIRNEMATLNTKMATQETHTGSIDTTVHALQGQMATLDIKIATQGSQTDTSVQNLTDQIATLDTKMATQETHTGSIDTTVHALQGQMATLDIKMDQQLGHVSAAVQELGTNIQKSEQHGRLGPGDQKYDELKQNLRKEIIDHYRRINCCKTAIPALIKGRKTDVNEVFVMPLMRVVEPGTSTSLPNKDTKKQQKDIRTIHDMFISEGEAIGKVYLRGEAGTGKTTLCQKIVSLWCDVHTGQQTENKTDEENFLKNIELLFYIPLRNHITSDIIEMIKKDVVREFQYSDLDLVLKTESKNCLIILDGLDEWTPSPDCKHEVPYIDPREKFKVLTTSRPWKLEVLRPEMCDLGQIELCKLNQDHLIQAVVKLLNSRSDNAVDWECFKYTGKIGFGNKVEKETYKKIKHLADIPVILTAMVCMWHDGEEIGTARIQAYAEMVEYLMKVAVKRNPMIEEPSTMMEPQKSTATELVDVFKGYHHCEMHFNTLYKLSDLAYHTLFNTKKENSLVFPHLVTEMYKLTERDVKFCLNIGLLSQSEFYGKAASDMKRISFLHKTLQEFFAAIFIAHGGKELLPPMKTLNDVFEMAEVLRFVSGLRPDWIGEISHHIAELTDRDDRILKYRNSLSEDYEDRYIVHRVQTIIHDCIVEVPADRRLNCKVELYDVIDHTFMGEVRDNDRVLLHLNTNNIKSLHMEINTVCDLIDKNNYNLMKLNVYVESVKDMEAVVGVINRCTSTLSVVSVGPHLYEVSSNVVGNFFSALCNISHLQRFEITGMQLNHSGIEELGRVLSISTQMRELIVSDIACTTCVQCTYTVYLPHLLQYIKIRNLDGNFILRNNTPLEYCNVACVGCDLSIIKRLKSSTTLQELSVHGHYTLYYIDSTTREVPPLPLGVYKVVTEVTPTLKNLRKLSIKFIDFKQEILRLSPEMTSLEVVRLCSTKMTLQCVQEFIDSLSETEFKVEMSDVPICPKEDGYEAVKYITDRHQIINLRGGSNISEDGSLYLEFINKPPSFR